MNRTIYQFFKLMIPMKNQSKPQPAVFLDRDGVLIHDVDYLSDLNDVKMYDDVPMALSKLKKAGFLLIMITNQSGVARGYFDEAFVNATYENIQNKLQTQLVSLDSMFYCPHHVSGHPPFNVECNCRKPLPGMILAADKQFNIDLSHSYMIGDKLCDIELALNTGTTGLLLKTGYGKTQASQVAAKYPDIKIFNRFFEATDFILSGSKHL